MRVHGLKTIRRRTDLEVQKDYHNYINDLRKDFYYICGYCGKHEMVSHRGMEPDHHRKSIRTENVIIQILCIHALRATIRNSESGQQTIRKNLLLMK